VIKNAIISLEKVDEIILMVVVDVAGIDVSVRRYF
jgi:hypothetical protein